MRSENEWAEDVFAGLAELSTENARDAFASVRFAEERTERFGAMHTMRGFDLRMDVADAHRLA